MCINAYTLILEKDFRIGEREKKYFLYKNYMCLRDKTGDFRILLRAQYWVRT